MALASTLDPKAGVKLLEDATATQLDMVLDRDVLRTRLRGGAIQGCGRSRSATGGARCD